MGENEMGSLLRTIIAVAVYGIIVIFFAALLVLIVRLGDKTHSGAYAVN